MALVGILLAAGRGRRFDPTGARNKLLQRLPGSAEVVAASARSLLAALPRVVAVVGPGDDSAAALLRDLGCEVTVCHQANTGMGASLAHAISHSLPAAGGWLVALGDMPHVLPTTHQALAATIEAGAGIAVPVTAGRRGNPVAFGPSHQAALLALGGDEGARRIVKSSGATEVAVDDRGILCDVDTPADLLAGPDSG